MVSVDEVPEKCESNLQKVGVLSELSLNKAADHHQEKQISVNPLFVWLV